MPNVIYNGNRSDGGLVPVDSNTYSAGNTVNVAVNDSTNPQQEQKDSHGNPENILTGTLTRTGATFLYWNTAADGSGTYSGPSAAGTFPFPRHPGHLTLYAQWAVSTGLTNGGSTTHYKFQYDEKLGGAGGIEPARTNAVIAACEGDFNWMQHVELPEGQRFTLVVFTQGLGPSADLTMLPYLGRLACDLVSALPR